MNSPSWASATDNGSRSQEPSDLSWAEAPKSEDVNTTATTRSSFNDTTPTVVSSRDTGSSSGGGKCFPFTTYGLSLGFFAAFVVAAILQTDDLDWLLFYCISAASVALFVLHRACYSGMACLEKPVAIFGLAITIWAIVLLVIASIKLAKAKNDNDDDEKKERAYEVTGSAVGLLSGIYHFTIMKCCGNKKQLD